MVTESISVVIPVYNSQESLPELVERLHAVLAGRGVPFEIILVNDGSRDRSWEVVAGLASQWPAVRGINLSRNYGQHNALLCGIRAAKHDVIVTMDDDLQNPPEEIPRLLEGLAAGADVVYGRPEHQQHGWWRDAASSLTKLALRHVMGAATARHVSAFRAFRTRLRRAFADYRSPYVSVDVLLSWGTARFTAVRVRHVPRRAGRSNYTLARLFVHALNLLTGFSTAPLRLASLVGFVVTALGLIILVGVLARYVLEGSAVPGFPFLASVLSIFSGTQLFALGIIGEYLGRMHSRMMERPPYSIDSTTRES
jgi:undecaprenyl-phosphate 4-deoxy-4-formamido-L-arabinose transferase